MSKGFTLAEVIVAMGITAVVGAILVAVFASTLRGSNKSQILAIMKQNGQVVLEDIDKTIRDSDDLICSATTDPGNNTLVLVKKGVYTRYRISRWSDGSGTAPSSCLGTGANGCIVKDMPVKSSSETIAQFINNVCWSGSPIPYDDTDPVQILTDTKTDSGVKIESGYFAISKSSGYKPSVTVNFVLKPGVGLPSGISNQIDPVSFQTTIECRNCQ